MPNPLYTTTQLVGIGTNSPEMKLHIQSEDQEFYSDFQSSLMQDIRHIRLSYLKRSNSNGIMLPGSGNAMSIIEDYDWDIKNENGLLSFDLTENLSSTSYNVFALTQTEAWVRKNLTVNGNTTLNGLTATSLSATDITTDNLTVNNMPTFNNGIKIKNSALQITDANNNIIWNFRPDGKLGIGVSTAEMTGPYWMWVKNGIMTERLKVAVKNTADWKDYVFDKSYKLMPIDEVESYIQTHKHLPDIPSAEEVVKDGIDVQTMDAKLLQKIEELTLYVIDLKKEIEQLKTKK